MVMSNAASCLPPTFTCLLPLPPQDTVLDDDERPGDQDWEWGTASQDLGPAPAAAKTQADSGRPTRGSRRAGGR